MGAAPWSCGMQADPTHPSQGSGAALGQPQDTSASPPAEPRRHLLLIWGGRWWFWVLHRLLLSFGNWKASSSPKTPVQEPVEFKLFRVPLSCFNCCAAGGSSQVFLSKSAEVQAIGAGLFWSQKHRAAGDSSRRCWHQLSLARSRGRQEHGAISENTAGRSCALDRHLLCILPLLI